MYEIITSVNVALVKKIFCSFYRYLVNEVGEQSKFRAGCMSKTNVIYIHRINSMKRSSIM